MAKLRSAYAIFRSPTFQAWFRRRKYVFRRMYDEGGVAGALQWGQPFEEWFLEYAVEYYGGVNELKANWDVSGPKDHPEYFSPKFEIEQIRSGATVGRIWNAAKKAFSL